MVSIDSENADDIAYMNSVFGAMDERRQELVLKFMEIIVTANDTVCSISESYLTKMMIISALSNAIPIPSKMTLEEEYVLEEDRNHGFIVGDNVRYIGCSAEDMDMFSGTFDHTKAMVYNATVMSFFKNGSPILCFSTNVGGWENESGVNIDLPNGTGQIIYSKYLQKI